MSASLRTRLLAALGLTAVLAVAVTAGLVAVLGAHAALDDRRAALRRQADAVATSAAELALPRRSQLRVVVVAGRRRPALVRAVRTRLAGTPAGAEGELAVSGRRLLYVRRDSPAGPLVAVRPRGRLPGDAGLRASTLVLAALAGLAIAALVALVLAGRLAAPLRRLRDAMGPIARGEPFVAPPRRGPREVDELEDAVAALDADLRRAREAERRFLATVSHELRTPLTALGGWAEALADGHASPAEVAEVVRAESARLGALVDDLLLLGRAGAGALQVADEEVDLGAVAREAAARFAPAAAAAGVALRVEATPGATGRGDPARLVQALSNLVDNAVRVVGAGGTVVVGAAPGELGVDDDGPGLEPEDRARAFEPLHLHRRLGPERAGRAGLGLALVAELARAMGATAALEPRRDGGRGTRAVLRLRAAAATGVPAPTGPDHPPM